MRWLFTAIALALCLGADNVSVAQSRRNSPSATTTASPQDEFTFFFNGTIPQGGLSAAWARLPFDSITLERTACLGMCPVYRVTFYKGDPKRGRTETFAERFGRAELTATYLGRNDQYVRPFAPSVGQFAGWLDIWTFAHLSLLIRNANIASLPDGRVSSSDAGTTLLSVTGRLKKTVAGGGGRDIELWAIQEAIDSAAKSVAWKPK